MNLSRSLIPHGECFHGSPLCRESRREDISLRERIGRARVCLDWWSIIGSTFQTKAPTIERCINKGLREGGKERERKFRGRRAHQLREDFQLPTEGQTDGDSTDFSSLGSNWPLLKHSRGDPYRVERGAADTRQKRERRISNCAHLESSRLEKSSRQEREKERKKTRQWSEKKGGDARCLHTPVRTPNGC